MNNYATLREDSPFYPIFPQGVPIKNILVVLCEGDGVQEVCMVDLDRLSPSQFDAVSKLVHRQCGPDVPLEVARKEMKAKGLPLRSKHVATVSTDCPFFL